jgi:hypothetical protein
MSSNIIKSYILFIIIKKINKKYFIHLSALTFDDFMNIFKTWLRETYGPDNFIYSDKNIHGK